MLVIPLPLTDGSTEWVTESAQSVLVPYHQLSMSFSVAPSAGKLSVEYQSSEDDTWVPILEATNITLGQTARVQFAALASRYRLTLSGVTGGSGCYIRITDNFIWPSEVMPDGVFWGNRAMTTQGYIEGNIKRGVQYEVSSNTPSLAIGGNIDTIFITGNQPVVVKNRIVKFNGISLLTRVFSGATYTGGTPVTYYNLNDRNPVAGTVQIIGGSTVTGTGTEFGAPTYDIGSTDIGNTSVSTFSAGGFERVLKPNTVYLQRITNDSGAAQRVTGYLTWYEGQTDLPRGM